MSPAERRGVLVIGLFVWTDRTKARSRSEPVAARDDLLRRYRGPVDRRSPQALAIDLCAAAQALS